MNLAFHLGALIFLGFITWLWLLERDHKKLLCELIKETAKKRSGSKLLKVYVGRPETYLKKILSALDIPIVMEFPKNSHPKSNTDHRPVRIDPLPFFSFLLEKSVKSVNIRQDVGTGSPTESITICTFIADSLANCANKDLAILEKTFGERIKFQFGQTPPT